jgi:ribonuclease HI
MVAEEWSSMTTMADSWRDRPIFFPSLSDPKEAELRACEQGLVLVKRLNLHKVVLEMDSSVLVNKLSSDQRDRSRHGPRIEKLKPAAGEIEDCVIKWAR